MLATSFFFDTMDFLIFLKPMFKIKFIRFMYMSFFFFFIVIYTFKKIEIVEAYPASPSLLQAILAQGQGLMFCKECQDPLREGSYAPALETYYNPSKYFVQGELLYGVPNDGSRDLYNAHHLYGRIAVLDRGKVPFASKVRRAQEAGAIGVVIVDHLDCQLDGTGCDGSALVNFYQSSSDANMGGFLASDQYVAWRDITIPSIMVTMETGQRLKALMDLVQFELDGEMQYTTDVGD